MRIVPPTAALARVAEGNHQIKLEEGDTVLFSSKVIPGNEIAIGRMLSAIEDDLLDTCEQEGMGVICFSPLAQGLLTTRYLSGIPRNSRVGMGSRHLRPENLDEQTMDTVRALNEIAMDRDQSLAQLALSWILREERITSVLVGASNVTQLDADIDALSGNQLTDDDLIRIETVLAEHQL